MCSNTCYKILLGCLFLTLTWGKGIAQNINPDRGLPYFKTFLDKDHGGRQQSYDFAFDKRGIVYVGNSDGVLEYDGTRWNKISINSTRHILTLDYDTNRDRMYLGGYTEFGYFDANHPRKKEYKSLLPLVNPEEREFTKIKDCRTNGSHTFFLASERIFVFDGKTIQSFDPNEFVTNNSDEDSQPLFRTLFVIDNTPYVVHSSAGLLKWTTSGFERVENGSFFEQIANIRFIKPYQNNTFLLGTENGNLYTFDKSIESFNPFKTEADDYLKERKLTNGVVLNNGSIGLTTVTGGFLIVDNQGKWIQLLNKNADLPANYVLAAKQAPKGAIWLAMNSGITRVEWPPVISIIDDRLTNFDEAYTITRFNDDLYVGTPSGLFKKTRPIIESLKDKPLISTSSFQKMSDSTYLIYYIQQISNQLGIASNKGLFLYDPESNQKKSISSSPTLAILPSNDPDLFHIIFPNAYTQLRYNKAKALFELQDSTYSFKELLHEIVIGTNNIWYIAGQSIFRQDLGSTGIANSFTELKEDIGLPDKGQYGGALFDGRFTVGTTKGAYRYIEDQQQFVPDTTVNNLFEGINIFYGHKQIDENSFWISYQDDEDNSIARISKKTEGKYEGQFAPFNRISQTVDSYTYRDPIDSTITWIAAVEGLLHYDHHLHKQKKYNAGDVIIREVHTIQNDSLLLSNVSTRSQVTEFPSDRRSLRFLFALPGNDAQNLTTYKYYLEGFDKSWSMWTSSTQKDYTNIPPGEYTFYVKAQNAYGKESETAFFKFEIATPWYQSVLAYLLYVIFGIGGLVYIAIWYSNYRTEQRAIRMRAEQAEELAKLDRMKTNLLTNISHELRTPLTLVLGPLEQLRNRASELGEDWIRRLDIAQRNGNRLQQLVEQVLDLTRLDAQQLELDPANIELNAFLGRLTESFESMAEQQELSIKSSLTDTPIRLQADPDKLEKVIVNLLSNAIKFTPAGGSISVATKTNRQTVTITVTDTGRGISEDRLPYIFDRFHSTSEKISSGGKGLGVGLAITKEFIELHGGTISVESKESSGTTFTIALPHKEPNNDLDDYTLNTESKEIDTTTPSSASKKIVALDENPFTALVVEDNEDMRDYIADLLEDKNLVVETAQNGLEAQKRLSIIDPDLIISDIMMPEMDGFTFAEKVRKDPQFRLTPIVMLSARAEIEDRIQGYEIGVSDYLVKPFNEAELKARVNNLLHRKVERERYTQNSAESSEAHNSSLVEKIKAFVEANLSESKINVEQLSQEVNLSRRQLYRNLKAETGCTPAEFIREVRLYNARDILESKQNKTVSEVAYAVGFSTPSYFSKLFKERFGCSPSHYG